MVRSLLQKWQAERLIPLFLFPYVQLIFFALIPLLAGYRIPLVLVLLLVLAWWVTAVVSAVKGMKQPRTAAEFAVMNLTVKCLHIPAYLFYFGMGVLGELLSIMGIWLVLFAFFTDCLTIFCTGLHAVGAVGQMKREGVPTGICTLCGIGSFLFCADVIVAVYMACKTGVQKSFLLKIKQFIAHYNNGDFYG